MADDNLQTEIDHLTSIVNATRLINSTLDLDELMEQIRKIAKDELNAEKATIVLGDEDKRELHSVYLEDTHLEIDLPFGSGIGGIVAETGKSLLIDDAQNDPRFYKGVDEISGYTTQTIVCAPMYNKEHKLIGVFQALNSKNGKFSENDRRFLEDLSIQAALAIENAFLYAEAKEKKKLEEDLDLARDIQKKLLPLSAPAINGYDIAGINIPAQAVGGDYFDFVNIDKKNLIFALGDVSGKGISAALLMASLQASFRAQSAGNVEISEMTSVLNNHICNSTTSSKYITFFSGILDIDKGAVRYCNAGHNPPLIIRKQGDVEKLNTGGIPLGFVPDFQYSEEIVDLDVGDLLVVYSDGVTETFDDKQNEFAEKNLTEILLNNLEHESKEIIENILDSLKEFSGDENFDDDVTLLIVKRTT